MLVLGATKTKKKRTNHKSSNRQLGRLVSVREVRQVIADYMQTEGCSCCQDIDGHKEKTEQLAKMLGVPKYDDGSGYDFYKFRSAH